MNSAETLICAVIFAVLMALALILLRRQTSTAFAVLSGLYVLVFAGTPALWLASISPIINDPGQPKLLGIGGKYGLDPAANAESWLVWASVSIILLLVAWFAARRFRSSRSRASLSDLIEESRMVFSSFSVSLFAVGVFVAAACLLACYIKAAGWEGVWYLEVNRFAVSASGGGINGRALATLQLLVGCCGAVLVVQRRFVLGVLSVLCCALPFLCTASRGAPLLLFGLGAAICVRARAWWARCIGATVTSIVVLITLLAVLGFRNRQTIGLIPFEQEVVTLCSNPATSLEDGLIATMQNVSVGFPIFCEGKLAEFEGTGIWDGLPIQYKLLSFSPLPSSIDHFNRDWLQATPFLNQFTPFNAISELWALNSICMYAIIVLHFCVFAGVQLWYLSRRRLIEAYFVILLAGNALLQAQQYPLRTFVKMTSVSLVLMFVCSIALTIIRRRARRHMPDRSTGPMAVPRSYGASR